MCLYTQLITIMYIYIYHIHLILFALLQVTLKVSPHVAEKVAVPWESLLARASAYFQKKYDKASSRGGKSMLGSIFWQSGDRGRRSRLQYFLFHVGAPWRFNHSQHMSICYHLPPVA